MIAVPMNERRVAGYLLLFKVVYLTSIAAAVLLWPAPSEKGMIRSFGLDPALNGHVEFRDQFRSTDSEYYLFLSEKGYERDRRECAFYPLYPLLIRWVRIGTGCNDVLIGMILANLFSLIAFLLFFRMVAQHCGESKAVLALALLLAFPGSLFFQFIYTESLFFLLLMLFCLSLERQYLPLAFATGFMLPLSRAVGSFCVFPLLWYLFVKPLSRSLKRTVRVKWFAAKLGDCDSRVLDFRGWRPAGAVCLVMAPLLGWATYLFLMWSWTGNAFEGIDAQKYYGAQSIHNLIDPVEFVTQFFSPTEWHDFRGSLLDRCVFILAIYCFPLIWRLDKGWCIWAFFLGVVPAVSGEFTSYTRFASVVFPMFVAMAVWLSGSERRWFRWFTLAVFVILHLILVWRFVNFEWAG